MFLKCRVVDARNLRRGIELDSGDSKRFANFFESNGGAGVDMGWRETGAGKLRGQRHGEAPGVRRADQLFRVRARLAVLETCLERIREVEGPTADSQPPISLDQIPFPFRFRFSH